MTQTPHDELADAAAYALGSLDRADRERFEAHLRTCKACAAEVDAFRGVAAGIGATVEAVPPPPDLKARVIETARATEQLSPADLPGGAGRRLRRSPLTIAWLAAAAGIVLAVGAGFYAWTVHTQLAIVSRTAAAASSRAETLRGELNAVRRDAMRTTRLMDVLTAADTVRISLAGTKAEPSAKGQAYWSPSRGVWFSAEGLPALSAGRMYQLWLVVPQQAPASLGLLGVNPGGSGTMLSDARPQPDVPKAAVVTFAITEEPAAGSPGPTTAILLAGTGRADASRP